MSAIMKAGIKAVIMELSNDNGRTPVISVANQQLKYGIIFLLWNS